jgi:TRAP-type mannitol/chloroaromatic compound transport system substrate-binding protein
MRILFKHVLVCASFALGAATAHAEPVVTLEMLSTSAGSVPILGQAAHRLAEKVKRASGGEIEITFREPSGALTGSEVANAVAEGKVDAAWAGAGWFSTHDITFNFFSSVPFGPGVGEYLAWMYEGGGLEMARRMFQAQGVYNIPCGLTPPEASGWFRHEIRSLDDLKGMKMRFFGLGAKVMEKMGVETIDIPPPEIFSALQSGKLDAAEFSLPATDEPLGLQEVAKYYYFPGWHQPATFFDLDINLAVWDKLEDRHKAIIELACSDEIREMVAESEAAQWKTIDALKAEGVHIRRWPPLVLVAFEDAWKEVVAEESAKNPNFKRVYESYAAFREKFRPWKFLSSLD